MDQSVLSKATLTTRCPWKGTASYYNIAVDGIQTTIRARDPQADIENPIGKEVKDAAWYYPEPITDKAAPIKDHVAFCM